MKKLSLLIGFLCFICIGLNAQTNVITVDTPDEFVDAIGSDRIIQLKGSTIYLSNISSVKQGNNYRFNVSSSSLDFSIFGVNNMKIVGLGDKPVKIITNPVDGYVLSFENCNNITIENVEAGHGPLKGEPCSGGVFSIYKSKNFTINKSILFGSGTEGISAGNVSGLKCKNSIIRACTYSIMNLNSCNDFEFDSCEFSDNKERDLINVNNCINVKFNSCNIYNNRTSIVENTNYALFNVLKSMSVVIKDCLIENNLASHLSRKASTIEMINTKFENNTFKKGNFQE